MHALALTLAVVAVLAAFVLTIVPVVVPGTLLVPAGALAAGAADGFGHLPWWSWLLQAVLVAAYLLVDNLVQVLGVQRVGGSKAALWGGTIGVFAGPLLIAPFGPLAVVFGAPAGAVAGTLAGELWHRHSNRQLPAADRVQLARLGITAVAAWLAGTFVKLVVVALQAALLIALLLWH